MLKLKKKKTGMKHWGNMGTKEDQTKIVSIGEKEIQVKDAEHIFSNIVEETLPILKKVMDANMCKTQRRSRSKGKRNYYDIQ